MILLQAGNAGMMNLIFIGAMIVIFWLFMIRPQQKRQKEQQAFSDSLQKGDEVVTASGLIGRINKLDDYEATLEVSNKTFVRVLRSAISKEMTASHAGANQKDAETKA
ncbi:preprotein translocase subunit YajC [Phaeodactylibacter luteus]|uniref:Sec translocon accessory complex subunit YajC n=1 Tax=Phaeodactylibacter luteus TaxID=1564516 RepID=A0A5C6RJA6_9BACT|nr:preprotein translocase subunit YajC [Phaeodactylibacter luteus]